MLGKLLLPVDEQHIVRLDGVNRSKLRETKLPTFSNLLTEGGKSQYEQTPTSLSPAPMEKISFVFDGANETILLSGRFVPAPAFSSQARHTRTSCKTGGKQPQIEPNLQPSGTKCDTRIPFNA